YVDQFAPLPAFITAWKIPPRRTPEFDALSLAGKLLFDGDSSRLYQKLVKGEESVVQLFGNLDERRGPSAMWIGAIPKPGEDLDQIRQSIADEIKELATIGVTEEEMGKLRNQLFNDEVRGRQSTMFRAQRLAEFALYDGDPNLFNTEFEQLMRVTPEDIKNAVAKFLDTDNRSNIDIVPANVG
ncbi:MAG: insulinase family protein, partial [Pyrinomonadaceae bacterium]